MRGLLYISYIYTGSTAGLTAWLFAGLAIGSTAGIEGVANSAGPLRAVFAVPVVWFKVFLAFSYLAYALI